MNLIHDFTDGVQNVLFGLNSKKSIPELDVDCYGVGAMMPQDMPDDVMLNNTALYGV